MRTQTNCAASQVARTLAISRAVIMPGTMPMTFCPNRIAASFSSTKSKSTGNSRWNRVIADPNGRDEQEYGAQQCANRFNKKTS